MSRILLATVAVSLMTLAIGLWLRLGSFYNSQQLLLDVLLFSVVALDFLFLVYASWRHWPRRPRNSLSPGGPRL